jgi:serine/threonine protein phosphatase PrpC
VTRFRWGASTDVGQVRTVNQDAMLSVEGFFAVADGMGGHRGGEVASALALEVLGEALPVLSTDELVAAIRNSNRVVFARSLDDPSLRGMGTTMCALALVADDVHDGPVLAVANVGDSRIYRLTNGQLEQVSQDHSMVAELLRLGTITATEAEVHPQRNVLTRALGIDGDLDVDVWQIPPTSGDRWMLCSDGLFNEVSESMITAVLAVTAQPQDAADELVRLANEGGGRDNITVVVIDVIDEEGHAAAGLSLTDELSTTQPQPIPVDVSEDMAVRHDPARSAPRTNGLSGTARWLVATGVLALCALAIVVFASRRDDTADLPTPTVPPAVITTVTSTTEPSTTTSSTSTTTVPSTTVVETTSTTA